MPGQAVQLAAPGARMSVGCCAGRSRGAARGCAGPRGVARGAAQGGRAGLPLAAVALHGRGYGSARGGRAGLPLAAVARDCAGLRGAATRGRAGLREVVVRGCVGRRTGRSRGVALATVALHGRGMARRSRRPSTNRGDCVGGARSDACLSTKSAGCMVWGSSAAEMGLMLEELFLKTQRNRR